VGASELVIVVRRNGKLGKVKTFSNTPEGHTAIIAYLNPDKHSCKVCLEATGTYHLDVAVALSRASSIEVMVMNPKAVKNFANALMLRLRSAQAAQAAQAAQVQRNKTDATVY